MNILITPDLRGGLSPYTPMLDTIHPTTLHLHHLNAYSTVTNVSNSNIREPLNPQAFIPWATTNFQNREQYCNKGITIERVVVQASRRNRRHAFTWSMIDLQRDGPISSGPPPSPCAPAMLPIEPLEGDR